jgi:Domain of unknown function (DUF1906)
MPTDASDVISELQGRPWLQFVARYYRDPASRWPALTASEARRLSALGYKIVTVWEWHSADPAYFSYATGYNDALNAVRQAKTVGQPPGSAIYFAVDFNARGGALYQVDQYFRGANAGLAAAGGGRPEYKIGVYGSGAVCAAIRGTGLAQYAWLTGSTAWDGTAGYSGWNIRQAAQGARFPSLSFSHDANEAQNDYGGFQLGNYANAATPAATPAGAVVAAAAAVPVAAATAVTSALTAVVPAAAAATPPAPPSVPPPPAAAPVLASAVPPVPVMANAAPAPPVAAPPPPKPGGSAAEVAALAAAEPALTAAALAGAKAASRASVEPDEPGPGSRSPERTVMREEQPHERPPAHAAKEPAAAKRKAHTVSANSRAVAVPLRHPGGSQPARAHEPERRPAAPRRSEDHAAHLQGGKAGAVHVLDQPARRNADPRRPPRSHHAADT